MIVYQHLEESKTSLIKAYSYLDYKLNSNSNQRHKTSGAPCISCVEAGKIGNRWISMSSMWQNQTGFSLNTFLLRSSVALLLHLPPSISIHLLHLLC